MKTISFDHLSLTVAPAPLLVRDSREALIAEIVGQCIGTPEKKKAIARQIAVAARVGRWSETELHFLLKKKQDPTIRNYTGFVVWSTKIRKAPNQSG